MVTSQNHKFNQLKWLYSALTGVCAAFFFALFSGQSSLDDSVLLQISTLLFAVCFPLFATFALVHVILIEANLSTDACEKTLNQPWINRITRYSFVMFVCAFGCLIGHFSLTALIGAIVVSVCCYYSFQNFVKQLNQNLSQQ